MVNECEKYQDKAAIGNTLFSAQQQRTAAMKFICSLYGAKKATSVNEVRCIKASKGTTVRKLPPTEDSFYLHFQRCIYQVYIWKNAHVAMLDLPPATEFGYEKTEHGVVPKMMSQSPAVP